MYINQLEERKLSVEMIYLDPNNPRFWTEKVMRDWPDAKIIDADVQVRTQGNIENHGIQELCNSILRNGFLPLDRIVVRPIAECDNKYVVVEGNRRLSALKTLRKQIKDEMVDESGISGEHLQQLLDKTNEIDVLVYQGADTADIAWLLQGVRHISGIRDWQPAQRARLVANQIDKNGLNFREAGQQFGLTAPAVGRLYRSFKALEQMRQHDEFQAKAKNDYFTLFEEAIRNKDVKTWLEWDEDEKRFKNDENLCQFYSWIIPDEEHSDKRRRINDPRQIKKLGVIIAGRHDMLLTQIDQHELSIEAAHDRVTQAGQKYKWKNALEKACNLIADIPQSAISDEPDTIVEALNELINDINNVIKMAEAVRRN